HASACKFIKRIFSIMKHHFRILLLALEYDIDTCFLSHCIQACIPAALCALHNYIYSFDKDDEDMFDIPLNTDNEDEGQRWSDTPINSHVAAGGTVDIEDLAVSRICDDIVAAMWTDYQAILVEHAQRDIDAVLDTESDFIKEVNTSL
ncbi:hypothetical protein PISMIDRAFT_106685, partial [Pisolithus microcarpus 441]